MRHQPMAHSSAYDAGTSDASGYVVVGRLELLLVVQAHRALYAQCWDCVFLKLSGAHCSSRFYQPSALTAPPSNLNFFSCRLTEKPTRHAYSLSHGNGSMQSLVAAAASPGGPFSIQNALWYMINGCLLLLISHLLGLVGASHAVRFLLYFFHIYKKKLKLGCDGLHYYCCYYHQQKVLLLKNTP